MTDRLEKMRAKQTQVFGKIEMPEPTATQSSLMPPGQEFTIGGDAPKKPKKEKQPGPALTHKCGHPQPIRELENQPCPKCRNEARQKKAAAKKAKQGEQTARPQGRLPDGATIHARYDTASQTWTGTLAIISEPHGLFQGSASGVFRLLMDLDAQYRKSLTGA